MKKHKGFTIIEVVLVLAIAGLIFLMVFIVLPALQRNQRDAQRKNDLARVISAVQSYKANNRGKAPTNYQYGEIILPTYLLRSGEDSFNDPDGSGYFFTGGTIGTTPTARKIADASSRTLIYVFFAAKCTLNGDNTKHAGSNEHALVIVLESGGTYCANA